MTIKLNTLLIFIIIIIVIGMIICYAWNKIKRIKELENETINSSIGEPYLMEESISPYNITLTDDVPNENGGLSYLKLYTNDLNIKLIRDMYKNDLNIILPKDTYIILGAGSTMMVSATYYALQKKLKQTIYVKTNSDVFYFIHKNLATIAKNVEWVDKNSNADLEIIVSPSNPLGVVTDLNELNERYKLYDVVYDRFIFTGNHETINNRLYEEFNVNDMIYITSSFSKLGVPGARFGYLLTRDPEIAKYAEEYVNFTSVRYPTAGATVSRIAYYKYFNKRDWQDKIYNTITKRREFFYNNAEKHGIKIYNKNNLVPYIYTDKRVEWWLENFNVNTRKGSDFNDTDENSRFNLMIAKEYWEEFERRFSK
jgi:aspartate/methionine/tyrosine aminotransferase